MSVDECADTSTTLLMLFIILQGRQSTMPTLTAYQSLMAAHGGTFGALQQAIMNSEARLRTTSARVIAQTLTTQDGTFLTLLEVITTTKVGLYPTMKIE